MSCSEIITDLIVLLLILHANGAANHKTVNLHIEGRVKMATFVHKTLIKSELQGITS